jgi:tyrosyl-tRNA synthetase
MADIQAGLLLIDLLCQAGLTASKGEARRLIQGHGTRVNDHPVLDEAQMVTPDLIHEGTLKLSAGKKRHVLVKVIEIYEINN